MSHGCSGPNGQGLVPAFPGLSARSIPENPDIQRETLRLLLQYSAVSSLPKKQSETPHPEVSPESSARPAPSSSSTQVSRSCAPSHSDPTVAPSSGDQARVSPRASSQSTSPSQSATSVSSFRAISPRHHERQRTLRESVAISNASRNVMPSSSISPRSSRSISPTIEHGHIRRSNRSRVQPVNYYADPWGTNPLESDEPETNVEVTSNPNESLPQEPSRVLPHRANVRKLLYDRELGGRNQRHIINDVVSNLKPWKSWQGASGDLLVLAWSPDGTQFAAGAAAKSDEHNMVYNQPNNLLLGDLRSNSLKEIPDHWVPRPTSSPVDDPRLFMTVNNMQWIDNRLYTASFDKTVKIWDVDAVSNISCIHTLQHESRVATMSVSGFDPSILATGTESVLVWDTRDPETPTSTLLPLDRDTRFRSNTDLSSTALAWGQSPSTKEFLAGGLAEPGEDVIYKGHLGLWRARESTFETIRLASNSQNVFDIKWHSLLPTFATASPEDPHHARMKGIGTATKSLVRVFDLNCDLQKRLSSCVEFSCPALDINEVGFCPFDSNGTYVTASCTDGKTYVWDSRKGDRVLHELRHGKSLNPIVDQRTREAADVGVRVALWGSSLDQFYTGASDGVLKRWDIRRSSEDVLVENVATFHEEIMCAAFTEDQTHLLIGGSGGGVHVLSSGTCSDPNKMNFNFERAPEPENSADSGVAAGNELVSSGQVVKHEVFGMGQGPSYTGPFASWARDVGQTTSADQIGGLPLLKKYQDQQLDGPPLEDRHELDQNQRREIARQIQLAKIRNRASRKRKRRMHSDLPRSSTPNPAYLSSESSLLEKKKRKKAELRRLSRENRADKGPDQVGKMHRKKKDRKSRPIISNTESVDLTLDSETETEKPNRRRFDVNELREVLEEDHWFPASGNINPNFQDEIV